MVVEKKMARTLYVSDLDGTLLGSNQRTSEFTNETINRLVEKGMLFSYATARSYLTASKVTTGLNAKIPVIVYNGAMVVDNVDGSVLLNHFFHEDCHELLADLLQNKVYPLVYSMIDGKEKMSFCVGKCSQGLQKFLDSRKNDVRIRVVESDELLHSGDLFYITCIDDKDKLEPLYMRYKEKYQCVFQIDIYTGEQWLEIMPKGSTKANAVQRLKEYFHCDRVVVFGDGKNDIDMFAVADEAYSMANAVPELKEIATGVIGGNDEDGVARWLAAHYEQE